MRTVLALFLFVVALALLHTGLRPYWRAAVVNGIRAQNYEPLGRAWLWRPFHCVEEVQRPESEVEAEWDRLVEAELSSQASDAMPVAPAVDDIAAALSRSLKRTVARLDELTSSDVDDALAQLVAARADARAQLARLDSPHQRTLLRMELVALGDLDDVALDRSLSTCVAERNRLGAVQVPLTAAEHASRASAWEVQRRQRANAALRARGVQVAETVVARTTEGAVDGVRTLLEGGSLLAVAFLLVRVRARVSGAR